MRSAKLIAGKRGATRLAFVILLKFYTRHGRFPRGRSELLDEAIDHVAKRVQVPASELGLYEWSGSTIEYHRDQVRKHLGFRICTTDDAAKLGVWLAQAERRPERVREELLKHLREERIEPPTSSGRITRIVASALHNAEVARSPLPEWSNSGSGRPRRRVAPRNLRRRTTCSRPGPAPHRRRAQDADRPRKAGHQECHPGSSGRFRHDPVSPPPRHRLAL
jgi:hypothetical protein